MMAAEIPLENPLHAINTMTIPDAVIIYNALGFKLIAAEPRSKKPVGNNWNDPQASKPPEYWRVYPNYNIGCIAQRNRLLLVDVDNKADFDILCSALDPVLKQDTEVERPFWQSGTAEITSHTHNHGKLVFKVPEGATDLVYRKVSWKRNDRSETVVEFRCSDSQQDVLPPSIHPSGSKYEWIGDTILEAPKDLIYLIQHWEQYQTIIDTANPDYEEGLLRRIKSTNKTAKQVTYHPKGLKPEQFAEWNKRFSAVDICLRNGYEQIGDRLRPIGSTHEAGVQIQDDGKVYSHHANDPLNDGYPHDAYDCLMILECGNDLYKAFKQILKDLDKADLLFTKQEGATANTKIRTLEEIAVDIASQHEEWLTCNEKGKISLNLPK